MRHGEHGLLVTVEEAAQLWRVPAGTLRRWAHEDRWRRFGGPRSRHWLAEDVQTGWETRRNTRVDNGRAGTEH